MAIYDKPTKTLMLEFVREQIKEGQTFTKADAVKWFTKNYPKINSNTVKMHVDGMSINSRSRKHHASIKPGSGHDLFFKIDRTSFRLINEINDPAPIYQTDFKQEGRSSTNEEMDFENDENPSEFGEEASVEFAYERDLKNYLVKNLGTIEKGLTLYDDEGLSGIEYPAGGRFIDILAVDANNNYVVIELKVSKGYDRVVGQILRYMGWIEENLADRKDVRGIILAADISEDLKLATSRIQGVSLFEYSISFSLKPVTSSK